MPRQPAPDPIESILVAIRHTRDTYLEAGLAPDEVQRRLLRVYSTPLVRLALKASPTADVVH